MATAPTTTISAASIKIIQSESVGTAGVAAGGGMIGGGAATTVNVAFAGKGLLPLLVCNAFTGNTFKNVPTSGAVTLTEIVQLPLAGMVRPVGRLTVLVPAVAVTVVPPPQEVVPFGSGAITTPEGRVSTSGAVSVATLGFGLDSVTVRVDRPPALILLGMNDLASAGVADGVIGPSEHTEILLVSRVTAPVCANARPDSEAPVITEMLVSARMLPTNLVVVPKVAELPTCQYTLHA